MSNFEKRIRDNHNFMPKEGEIVGTGPVAGIYLEALEYAREHGLTLTISSAPSVLNARLEDGQGIKYEGTIHYPKDATQGLDVIQDYAAAIAAWNYFNGVPAAEVASGQDQA